MKLKNTLMICTTIIGLVVFLGALSFVTFPAKGAPINHVFAADGRSGEDTHISIVFGRPEPTAIVVPTGKPSPTPLSTPEPVVNNSSGDTQEQLDSERGGGILDTGSGIQRAAQPDAVMSENGDYRLPSVVGNIIYVDRNDPYLPVTGVPYVDHANARISNLEHRLHIGTGEFSDNKYNYIRAYDYVAEGDMSVIAIISGKTVLLPSDAGYETRGCEMDVWGNTYVAIQNLEFAQSDLHLDSCNFTAGQNVSAYQVIGQEGNVSGLTMVGDHHLHHSISFITRDKYGNVTGYLPICNPDIFNRSGEKNLINSVGCNNHQAYRIVFYED